VDGDDLIGISIRENLSVAVIRELNNIPQDEDVKPGMVIKLPVPAL
jgi:LysM repeat protein